MRFESATAHAFGPFTERTLRFAPGMNLISGLNEAGKSSWHAALYAGLCGVRRARGQPRKEDREFAERYRPWESDQWEASVVVRLDDGRRVELRHDLDGRVDCRATDLDLGKDVSDEIIREGSPDGSRWLGLDRRSFLAVACVRQADLLGILEDPSLLREHLQRAAATAGTDATAAGAIQQVQDFRSEHVGRDLAHSSRPLPLARRRVAQARQALDRARRDHDDFLSLRQRAEEARESAEDIDKSLRLAQAARARQDAAAWERRLVRARQLVERHPQGPPPALSEDDRLAREVTAALRAWKERPEIPALTGPSAEELRERLGELPTPPEGDLEPHPDILNADNARADASRRVDLHLSERPPTSPPPAAGSASSEELRETARDLEVSVPAVDPGLEERHRQLTARLDQPTGSGARRGLLVVSGVAATAGVALLLVGVTVPGAVLLVGSLGLLAWSRRMRGDAARLRLLEEFRGVQSALGDQQHVAQEARQRREGAERRAAAMGLEPDPGALRRLADALDVAHREGEALERWIARHDDIVRELEGAESRLAQALHARGVEVGTNLEASFQRYVEDCRHRARAAGEAARRPSLEAQLADRRAAEDAASQVERNREQAERDLHGLAAECGLGGDDPGQVGAALADWERRRSEALAGQQAALEEWAELESLLEGRTLEEVEVESERSRSRAEELAGNLDPVDLEAVEIAPDSQGQMDRLQREAKDAREHAAALRGQADERAGTLPSVPEAEEELAHAEARLAVIESLDDTLAQTLEFLMRAQERVHRTIAPVLADTVRPWLAEVTLDRYVEVVVDPESLDVRVRGPGGQWRRASLLSHGTAEQVYLLLRAGLAEHLTRKGETCPLILDDPTAQWDPQRTEASLRVLHAISRERQVVVFSQEADVLAWAQVNLHEPQGHIERLEVVAPV